MIAVDAIKLLVATAALLGSGTAAISAETNLWVIDDDSVAPEQPGSKTLSLFSEQQTMGGGAIGVPEFEVTMARPLVFAPPSAPDSPGSHDYYLVKLPFTVHPPSNGRRVDELELHVRFGDSEATGFMLIPDAVVSEKDIQRTYDLSAALSRGGIELGGGLSYVVGFKHVTPVVRSFGENESSFYWLFKRQKGALPLLGSQATFVIVRVPRGMQRLTASLQLEGRLASRYPWQDAVTATTLSDDVMWDFGEADSFDAIPWSKAVIEKSTLGQ